jgi:predicted ribonuclease YlaK
VPYVRYHYKTAPVKILTKLLTSRLQQQISKLVDVDQIGFIKGRSIPENFVLATELV